MRIRLFTPILALAVLACAPETPEDTATAEGTQEYEVQPGADVTVDASLAGVADSWEQHYNLGHPDMVADFHAEDGLMWTADGAQLFGREAIAAELQNEIEMGSPQAAIETDATIVEGEWAFARGSYEVDVTPEGEQPIENSGYWTGLFHNVEGEWVIQGLATNLDSEDQTITPAETGELPEPEPFEMPPALTELHEQYETHFNLGHADMVADLYAEDAVAMFSGMEAAEGRAAIAAALAERFAAGQAQIDLEPYGIRQLSEDVIGGIGTYTLTAGGETQEGHYAAVYERAEDGSWKLKWALSATHPSGGM